MLSLGIDIGGTKIEVIILDNAGNILFQRRYDTLKASFEQFCDQLRSIVQEARERVEQNLSIGICIPGTVTETGTIKNSNILVLNGRSLPSHLEKICEQHVAISNDANCFALSEAVDGAAQGYSVVFGLTLGTGCGGGVVINQKIREGRNRVAGEWGHNGLPWYQEAKDGLPAPCYCGKDNCIETFISGTGLSHRFSMKYGHNADVKTIINSYYAQEPQSIAAIDLFLDQLARSLASVVNTLDPDIIVVGGGMSGQSLIFDNIQQRVASYTFGKELSTPIVPARFGGSSGVRGAAWLGRG